MSQSDNQLRTIASDETIDLAYAWLCHARRDAHHNHEIWHLRTHWAERKGAIQAQLLAGTYQFSPCKSCKVDGVSMSIWGPEDALVLKAMTLVLTEYLKPQLSDDCYHLAGRGGQKGCVREVESSIGNYNFVCRSDVNSYYATIDHDVLIKQLKTYIQDEAVITLIKRMLDRVDDVHAELFHVTIGISNGNSLSPLLGAVYLDCMDKVLSAYCKQRGLRYFRYMDDWLILCNTRNQLRTVVKLMNQILEQVKQTKHPLKTYIGRIREQGLDFLGYSIGNKAMKGLGIAWQTWMNHLNKLQQLYEQHATMDCLAEYVKRWLIWLRSGVDIDLRRALEDAEWKH